MEESGNDFFDPDAIFARVAFLFHQRRFSDLFRALPDFFFEALVAMPILLKNQMFF